MYLVKLDANNVVVSCTDASAGPFLRPLDASLMLTVMPAPVGQVFDSEAQTFRAPPRNRWLTKLAFDSRFTMAEATKLKLAMMFPARLVDETDADYSTRCALPAMLQVMAGRLALASYIDLGREDTQTGVRQLEAVGLLAPGRADEILSNEIADIEFHRDAS